MSKIKELEEKLESAIGGCNSTDIEFASAELEAARSEEEITNLKRVLKIVYDTLPYIDGNERSVNALMSEIKTILIKV